MSRLAVSGETRTCSSTPKEIAEKVDPPIQVETTMWSKAGQLDWRVKERREWFGRIHGADGRQWWIRAVDLRPASSSQP